MERITDWQHELAASGARVGDGGVITDFGDVAGEAQAAREAAVVVPLSDLGLITASGADAAEFLNLQFTSDIALVSPHRAQYSGYCNPKGRLLATMLLFQEGDAFRLSLPAELAGLVAQHLQK
ncbi:MAG: folate-binding protein, partial [Betaproteobacteria bacterium]